MFFFSNRKNAKVLFWKHQLIIIAVLVLLLKLTVISVFVVTGPGPKINTAVAVLERLLTSLSGAEAILYCLWWDPESFVWLQCTHICIHMRCESPLSSVFFFSKSNLKVFVLKLDQVKCRFMSFMCLKGFECHTQACEREPHVSGLNVKIWEK